LGIGIHRLIIRKSAASTAPETGQRLLVTVRCTPAAIGLLH
jgi:hypothetical protein